MSFIASARKYRPQRFIEVLGQAGTVRTLQNTIRYNRLGNCYLFCGPRGTGKTTLARLLAKALNCDDLPRQLKDGVEKPEPCGTCNECQNLVKGVSTEILEIDAASHRGIDDAKAIQGLADQMPKPGKWRIVIIDECHMLTKEAQAALLILFENPPSSFLPILCTTNPEALTDTIRSRCSTFHIRPIPATNVEGNLKKIFADANQTIDDSVIHQLALSSEGSLRDVQQICDQLIGSALGHCHIDDEFYESVTGQPSLQLYKRVAGTMITAMSDPAIWYEEVAAMYEEGVSLSNLFYKVISNLIRDFEIAIVSRSRQTPCVPYLSGMPHELFQSKMTLSEFHLDAFLQSWEETAKNFGRVSERADLEMWFIRAYYQCEWERKHSATA